MDRDRCIEFLQHIKATGQQAWQRLQAIQAIEFYRNSVLKCREPSLHEIRSVLAARVAREQRVGSACKLDMRVNFVNKDCKPCYRRGGGKKLTTARRGDHSQRW